MPRYIDAEKLKAHYAWWGDSEERKNFDAIVDAQPTADVEEVKHEKWDDSYDGITPYCTGCNRSHRGFERTPPYCPHCGARMDKT